MLYLNRISRTLFPDEEFVIDEHGDDGCHRAEDGRCLWTDEMRTAELYHDGESTHKQRNRDVLHDLRTVRHHQNQERGNEEHQRELQDDECGHLAEFLR